jgi:predicted GNAT family acetyltransferase
MTELVDVPAVQQVRPLTPADAGALVRLTARHPRANLFVRHRVAETGLRDVLLGGSVLGCFRDGELVAACHCGANLVPVEADDAAVDAFADHLLVSGVAPGMRRSASLVGPQGPVLRLWSHLESAWGPVRSLRADQPFLAIDHDPVLAADPRVRRVMIDEVDALYPASVAMFREEVGVDPEAGGSVGYRARVGQLVARGWAFAIIERGEVLFKTEVGAAADGVCQLQGVWVHPDLRGQGLAAPALAGVVRLVRRDVAPDVTLYVNDFNAPARAAYARVGMQQVDTFASVLL